MLAALLRFLCLTTPQMFRPFRTGTGGFATTLLGRQTYSSTETSDACSLITCCMKSSCGNTVGTMRSWKRISKRVRAVEMRRVNTEPRAMGIYSVSLHAMTSNVITGRAHPWALLKSAGLFPIPEQGVNFRAQPLQEHERRLMASDPGIVERLFRSYCMVRSPLSSLRCCHG